MLTLSSPPLLLHAHKHIPRGLAPWFSQGVQWNWAAQAFLDHPLDRWVQYLPPIAVDFLCCDLPKVRKQLWKRCQSVSSASWDAARLAWGIAWVWNSHCCCSPPWTLPEHRFAVQTTSLQPWFSVYGFFLCLHLLLPPSHCTRTRVQPQDPCEDKRVFPINLPAFLDCSCVWETLSLMNCQP